MIPKQFIKTTNLFDEYKEDISAIPPHVFHSIEDTIKNPSSGRFWSFDLAESYRQEFDACKAKEKFFIGCNFETYKKHYQKRFDEYTKDKNDAQEIDFIIKDYNLIAQDYQFYFAPDNIKEQIEMSLRRQREFLEQKVFELGYSLNKITDKWGNTTFTYIKKKQTDNSPLTDLSDSNSTIEKIIFLYQLGVIDYLKSIGSHGYSTNAIATLLSAFINEKSGTIQSYLNPIDNKDVSQRNNPLNNKERVKKINLQIIELGFTPQH